MTNESKKNLSDYSMLDLFQTEVETHTTTLNDGLLALETAPEAMDKLESLMRAAHSIKGGARIVELDAVVKIAHAMEDCFVALQSGKGMLKSQQIDVLLSGVDMIRSISGAAVAGNLTWTAEHDEEIAALVSALTHILEPETNLQTSTLDAGKIVSQEIQHDSQEESSALPAPRQTDPVTPQHTMRGKEAQAIDISLLELFRSEVETHVTTLLQGCVALQQQPESLEKLEPLVKAVHAIKGGGQIIESDVAVNLADAMEQYLIALQQGKAGVDVETIQILQQGSELLREIAAANSQEGQNWLVEHQEDIAQVMTTLSMFSVAEPKQISLASSERNIVAQLHMSAPEKREGGGTPSAVLPDSQITPENAGEMVIPPIALREQREEPLQKNIGERDRTVRVTATKIERLMGLAGEVVVSSRWLPSFSESLLALKKNQRETLMLLEKLRDILRHEDSDVHLRELVSLAREKTKQSNALLSERMNQLDRFTGASATLSDRLYHEVIGIRMRPFADGVRGFPRMVRDLARDLGKKVQFEIVGKSTEVDRDILEKLDAPLTHLLRNAIDHGIELPEERLAAGKPEAGLLRLEAVHRSGMLLITVSDDGRGIDLKKLRQRILRKGLAAADMANRLTEAELLKFLFLPGFSTSENVTEISGRGVGLDVVDNMVHEVGGVVRAMSKLGEGMSFYLELPLTLSVIRTFLVEIADEPYAFPLARIDRCLLLSKTDIDVVEDRQYFRFDNTNISLVDIHDVLELENPPAIRDELPVVIISNRSNTYGLLVDRFIGESDLVVRPLDSRLGKVPDISATAVMLDGSPILIFDVEDLVGSIDKMLSGRRLHKLATESDELKEVSAKKILVVDDSITVREMERKLLENRGYEVDVAVDGLAGWNALRAEHFDLVVSDVDMPRMNGIEFVTQIKQHEELKALPVIIVSYKDTEEHRLQGLQAGADYYLTKSSFQDDSFINAVVDLIGEA
ncbi:response regulator receiver domain protein [Candidatus Vecturithrix granuli]|uniref:histidine kinase n=1 Tax=Vecturithrix granuli TaxID=1499967 RepID=A0A081BXI4_VECG1|nr:response regulator receiver domain protein [Candidatus Vecturithrix granuli]